MWCATVRAVKKQWPAPVTNEPFFESVLEHDGAGFTYFKRYSSSLDVTLLRTVFGSLALVSLIIAAGFAAMGAWLIIPFAGLEIAALAVAASVVMRRAGDFESLVVKGDCIRVEIREQGEVRLHEFHCGWARLVTGEAGTVALRSHGREVAIGRYCGEESRRILFRELRSRLAGGRS